jgi:RNA polymerase sigma factor (sigma-70 family)
MGGSSSAAALSDVRTLFDAGTATGLSDRQLIERFSSRRDAASDVAFEVLILRRGPMVLRVCRNLLRNPDEAEDAFQATFLVLVKRRTSIRQIESVGGWLYGVACRVAARARVETARRRSAEERRALRVVDAVALTDSDEPDHSEFGPIVQEEVRRLPVKYRAVVALCYWQGLTQELAAAQLGCPLGTVRSRLARARKILHRRLARRGLMPLAGGVATAFESASASGSVASLAHRLSPVAPELARSTIRAASHVLAGDLTAPGVTALSAFLAQRVLWSMTMFKISSIVLALGLIAVVGVGAGIAAQRAGGSPAIEQANGGRDAHDVLRSSPGQPQAAVKQGSGAAAQGDNPSPSAKIYTRVAGQTTIISIIPDGSAVKKGQVICELDSARLRDQQAIRQRAAVTAEANHDAIQMARELAEIAVIEYQEGLSIPELQEIELQIKTAEAELAIAEDECEIARETVNKGVQRPKKRVIADLQLHKARLALEHAQSRKRVFVDYTKPKRVKELKLAVAKARSEEVVSKGKLEQEVAQEQKLEREVAACTIKATIDGTLLYAKPDTTPATSTGGVMISFPMGSAQRPIRVGAFVGDRELLFEIIPAPETK